MIDCVFFAHWGGVSSERGVIAHKRHPSAEKGQAGHSQGPSVQSHGAVRRFTGNPDPHRDRGLLPVRRAAHALLRIGPDYQRGHGPAPDQLAHGFHRQGDLAGRHHDRNHPGHASVPVHAKRVGAPDPHEKDFGHRRRIGRQAAAKQNGLASSEGTR